MQLARLGIDKATPEIRIDRCIVDGRIAFVIILIDKRRNANDRRNIIRFIVINEVIGPFIPFLVRLIEDILDELRNIHYIGPETIHRIVIARNANSHRLSGLPSGIVVIIAGVGVPFLGVGTNSVAGSTVFIGV